MSALRILLGVVAVLAVATKLFSYEYTYRDDPTTGVALRATPGLTSRRQLREAADLGGDRVVIADENDFPGRALYHLLVGGGWLGLPALAALTLAAPHLRRALGSRSLRKG